MPEDEKKKVKVRPGYNPRTNAMRNRREGAGAAPPLKRPKPQKPGIPSRPGKKKRKGLKMAPMPTRSRPIKPKDNKTEDSVWV